MSLFACLEMWGSPTKRCVSGCLALRRSICSLASGFQTSSISAVGSPLTSSIVASRCSAHRRNLVRRARSGSWVMTFTSESLNNECSLRFADPIVSQASSTMPILAWM
jgi:hypothetical protein